MRPGQLVFNWRTLPELLYSNAESRPSKNTLIKRLNTLVALGAVRIDIHETKRFSILTVQAVPNFGTVPSTTVSNFGTVLGTVPPANDHFFGTVSGTVLGTVLGTVPPKKSTNSLVKPLSKKERKKEGKKLEEGRERLTLTEIESFQFSEYQDLPDDHRQRLALEIQDAMTTGKVTAETWQATLREWTRATKARLSKSFDFDSPRPTKGQLAAEAFSRESSPLPSTSDSPSESTPSESTPSEPQPQADRPSGLDEVKHFFERQNLIVSAVQWYQVMNSREWKRSDGSLVADWKEQARIDNQRRIERDRAEAASSSASASTSTPPPPPPPTSALESNRVVTSPQQTP
ncbi:MAG: hypothetical protein EBR27_11925, partial [Betaproteobacteria bacterium]|nr:hypothetical protein [Betaproteobacteria bacterium]